MGSIDYCSRYSISVPTNASKSGEQEIGAESLHSYYGQLQLTKFTDTQEDTQSDTEQIYEQISNLDLQLEDEEAQPYCEPVKILAKTTAA